MCRAGTAPASYGLKDRRATFLLTAQLSARFQNVCSTNDQLAGLSVVMNPLALHLYGSIARRTLCTHTRSPFWLVAHADTASALKPYQDSTLLLC